MHFLIVWGHWAGPNPWNSPVENPKQPWAQELDSLIWRGPQKRSLRGGPHSCKNLKAAWQSSCRPTTRRAPYLTPNQPDKAKACTDHADEAGCRAG